MSTNWTTIGRDEFERIVEAIAHRSFVGAAVRAIEGRGGDGGRDIEVTRDGTLTDVLQLKYFPEGMSSGFSKRRRQVEKSWRALAGLKPGQPIDTATWPKGKPDHWIVVVPARLTDPEFDHLTALVRDSGVALVVWDRTWLDSTLAALPDLAAHFTKRFLEEQVELFNLEKAVMPNVLQLGERVSALKAVADTMDPDWTFDFSTDGQTTTQTIRPKHPNAGNVSPITIEAAFRFDAEQRDIQERFERSLLYGVTDSVTLPPEVLASLKFSGPPALVPPAGAGTLTMQATPIPLPDGAEFCVRELDSAGMPRRFHRTRDIEVGKGQVGLSMRATFFDTVELLLLINVEDKRAKVHFKATIPGSLLADAKRAVRLLSALARGEHLDAALMGERVMTLSGVPELADLDLSGLEELMGDLTVINDATGCFDIVPAEMTANERLLIRVIRRLMEGDSVQLPFNSGMTLNFNGDEQQLQELIAAGPQEAVLTYPTYTLGAAGVEVPLGAMCFRSVGCQVSKPDEALATLRSNSAGEVNLEMHGPDLLIASPIRESDLPAAPRSPRPWDLEGYTEPEPTGGWTSIQV